MNLNNTLETLQLDSSDSDDSENQLLKSKNQQLLEQYFYRNFSRKTYVQTCSNEYITGPQLKQFVGIASYHFGDHKDECFISYEKAPDTWKFDSKEPPEDNAEEDNMQEDNMQEDNMQEDNMQEDNVEEVNAEEQGDTVLEDEENAEKPPVYEKFSDLPGKRKFFTNVKIGPNPKEFYGEIDWQLDGVTVGKTTKWVYHFILDDDFAHITNGKCFMYTHDCPVGAHDFGVQLKYQIYIKECFTHAG